MQLRLIGAIVLIFALTVTLTGIAQAIPAQAIPFSDELRQFGFAACDLPCWAGIRVGETTLDESEMLFREYVTAPTTSFTPGAMNVIVYGVAHTGVLVGGEMGFSGVMMGNEPLEQHTQLTMLSISTPIPLWLFVVTLGTPDVVNMFWREGNQYGMDLHWFRDGNTIQASIDPAEMGTNWGRSANVKLMRVMAGYLFSTDSGRASAPQNLPWMGFAPLSRYAEVFHAAG
jgi:hypothetical protein